MAEIFMSIRSRNSTHHRSGMTDHLFKKRAIKMTHP